MGYKIKRLHKKLNSSEVAKDLNILFAKVKIVRKVFLQQNSRLQYFSWLENFFFAFQLPKFKKMKYYVH